MEYYFLGFDSNFYNSYYFSEHGQIVKICVYLDHTKGLIKEGKAHIENQDQIDRKNAKKLTTNIQEVASKSPTQIEFLGLSTPLDVYNWLLELPNINPSESLNNQLTDQNTIQAWQNLKAFVAQNKEAILSSVSEDFWNRINWKIEQAIFQSSSEAIGNREWHRILTLQGDPTDPDNEQKLLHYQICASAMDLGYINGDSRQNSQGEMLKGAIFTLNSRVITQKQNPSLILVGDNGETLAGYSLTTATELESEIELGGQDRALESRLEYVRTSLQINNQPESQIINQIPPQFTGPMLEQYNPELYNRIILEYSAGNTISVDNRVIPTLDKFKEYSFVFGNNIRFMTTTLLR
jgi:hypothetical protein